MLSQTNCTSSSNTRHHPPLQSLPCSIDDPPFLWVMGENECTNRARTEQPFCISHISHSFIFLSLFSCYHSIYGGKEMCGWFVEEQNVPWIDMWVSNDLGAIKMNIKCCTWSCVGQSAITRSTWVGARRALYTAKALWALLFKKIYIWGLMTLVYLEWAAWHHRQNGVGKEKCQIWAFKAQGVQICVSQL